MKPKILYWSLGGAGALAIAVAAYRVNEQRFHALEREVQAAKAEQRDAVADVPAPARTVIAASLRSPVAAVAMPAESANPRPPEAEAKEAGTTFTDEDVTAFYDSTFSQEPPDRAWASEAERSIGGALRKYQGSSAVESVECRQSMCKASIRHENQSSYGDFIDRVVGNSTTVWTGAVRWQKEPVGRDGTVRCSMYFAKGDFPVLE